MIIEMSNFKTVLLEPILLGATHTGTIVALIREHFTFSFNDVTKLVQ